MNTEFKWFYSILTITTVWLIITLTQCAAPKLNSNFQGTWFHEGLITNDQFEIKNRSRFERISEIRSSGEFTRWFGKYELDEDERSVIFSKHGVIFKNRVINFLKTQKIAIPMLFYQISEDSVMLDNILYIRTD